MRILICGSIAYDAIMVFQGRFKDHILPEQVHILNVSFLVPTLRQEFGGVAGNIAYNLAHLGEPVLPMATIGADVEGDAYRQRFAGMGIDCRCIRPVPGTRTAQCFITTDLDDNQIVAFHPGAMLHSHDNALPEDEEVRIALVGPDGRDGMLAHVERLTARGIDVLFDPGQALPLFSGDELLQIIGRVRYLAVNDYEARLLASKTGRSIEEMARGLSALVVTRGAEGSVIHQAGQQLQIPAAPARAVIDPTGCGDAFRAGLLTGLARGLDWETTGRLGSVMGALKIEHPGAQNHAPSREQVLERFAEAFGYRPF